MISQRILFIILTVFLALTLISQSASAQQRIAVQVIHSGKDSVGLMLSNQVKEDIRRSTGLRLTEIDEPRLIMHLTTKDVFKDLAPSSSTVLGYAITCKNMGRQRYT
jgi:hypothetical protein